MSESVNNLTLVINQQDADGVNIVNRTIGAFSWSGSVGSFFEGLLTTTGSTALPLPTANVLNFYIKNKHATATITLVGTPQSGASATLAVIQPGGTFLNWAVSSGASAGYTALALTASAVSTDYEAFIGG